MPKAPNKKAFTGYKNSKVDKISKAIDKQIKTMLICFL